MADDNNGFIRISNRELYDMMIQVRDKVGSLENRVDVVLSENVELRSRVRALELKTYTLLAGFTTGLGAAGLIALKGVFR
jgi:hypothetical protein